MSSTVYRQNGPPEKVFSLAPIVQLNIMESLGIMVFRHNIMHLLIFLQARGRGRIYYSSRLAIVIGILAI
jgi:hypothetical protein